MICFGCPLCPGSVQSGTTAYLNMQDFGVQTPLALTESRVVTCNGCKARFDLFLSARMFGVAKRDLEEELDTAPDSPGPIWNDLRERSNTDGAGTLVRALIDRLNAKVAEKLSSIAQRVEEKLSERGV
jgi:hypothetical protein